MSDLTKNLFGSGESQADEEAAQGTSNEDDEAFFSLKQQRFLMIQSLF